MKETEFDENLKKAITAEQRKEQKEFLRSLETSLSEADEPSRKFNWRIAASVALLVGLASTFFLWDSSPSNDELYSTYFQPYANVIEPIVRDQGSLSKKAQVFALYEQGEYEKAIDGFDAPELQDSLSVTTIRFYKANAYLKLKEYEKAKSLLLQVVDQNNEWKEESQWYLALLSLKSGNIDTTISYLKELQKNSSVFKNEVNDLLKTLE